MTHTFKILVTGPYAAGKTSLIQSVSQTPVVSTDVVTSGDEAEIKAHTTVAMDFGTYTVEDETPPGDTAGGADCGADGDADGGRRNDTGGGNDVRLLLFGTPGQPRFRFMTTILKGEVDIVAFVVDAEARGTHPAAGVELRSLLADLRVPAVIAVNRCDDVAIAQRVARTLGARGDETIVPCQLIDPESGRDVIIEILTSLLESMYTSTVEVEVA